MWDWLREHDWETWAAVAILLGVAELFSLDLVLLMLSVGALVGMVAALVGLPLAAQLLAAAVSAIAMLAVVRPSVARRLHAGPELRHGPAALVGRQAVVLAEVSPDAGTVKLAGEVWTARPYDESSVIPVGARVEVFEIKGATAYVHPVPELGA